MAEQARVTSLDTLESFRASLIIFVTRARNQVDLVSNEIQRTRSWLHSEQRLHWENEIRRRRRALSQAEQDLLSAKLSSLRDNIVLQMNAVRKAKAAVEEAEQKMRNVRKWGANFDSTVDPLAKKMESLREIIDYRIPKGIALLSQMQRTLEAYADSGPFHSGGGGTAESAAAEGESGGQEPAQSAEDSSR